MATELLFPVFVQFASLTLVIVYVVLITGATARSNVLLLIGPILNILVPSVYVNLNGAVLVKLTFSIVSDPSQTIPPPVKVAIGSGLIVTYTGAMVSHPSALVPLI